MIFLICDTTFYVMLKCCSFSKVVVMLSFQEKNMKHLLVISFSVFKYINQR